MRPTRTTTGRLSLALATVALLAAACGGQQAEDPAADGDEAAAGADDPEPAEPSIEGGEVTILGAFTDEQGHFRSMLDDYAAQTGTSIEYEGSSDFSTVVVSRVEGGNPPDIIFFPQPGAMADFASRNQLRTLDEVIDRADLDQRTFPGLLELGLVDGNLYAVPFTINIKSLVWYPQPAFTEAGYDVPETWDELAALTQQIQGDGATPWCLGIESGGSTGWVATDWIEDVMLRLHGPDVYDEWVSGQLPFDSPQVAAAFDLFADIALTDGQTLGGPTGILTTSFRDAPAPMFEDPPACFLHRQASFAVGLFPEGAEFGDDYGVFYLPPAPGSGDYAGRPLMGGGDIAALATDNPAAEEVLRHLTSPAAFLNSRAKDGGTLSAYTDVAADDYPLATDRAQAHILEQADVFRFDGSDLMPGQVGSGAFWTEIVAWINQEKDLTSALQAIDAAWPE